MTLTKYGPSAASRASNCESLELAEQPEEQRTEHPLVRTLECVGVMFECEDARPARHATRGFENGEKRTGKEHGLLPGNDSHSPGLKFFDSTLSRAPARLLLCENRTKPVPMSGIQSGALTGKALN